MLFAGLQLRFALWKPWQPECQLWRTFLSVGNRQKRGPDNGLDLKQRNFSNLFWSSVDYCAVACRFGESSEKLQTL